MQLLCSTSRVSARMWLNGAGVRCCLVAAPSASQLCTRPEVAPASHERPLQIAIDLWTGYYPALLAEQLGYFRAEGVAVELSIPEDTDQLLVDFAAGSLDGIGSSSADTINVVEANPDARIILFSDLSSGANMVLGMPPINIRRKICGGDPWAPTWAGSASCSCDRCWISMVFCLRR